MNLLHRITHMLRPAYTSAAPDETGTIATVQIVHNSFDTRAVPVVQQAGFACSLPVQTDVMTAQVGGDNSNGVIIATNNQTSRPKNMLIGETMVYDCQTTQQSIYLKSDGSITIAGFHKVSITCDTEVDITAPTVKITGNLLVTGDVTSGYGGDDQVDLQQHTHDGGSAPSAGT